jgi:3-oxoacyl-[acyl-carrier-protein] synthase-3
MGEAATASLVSHNGPGDRIRSYATAVRGELHAGQFMQPDEKEHNRRIGTEMTVEVIHQALADAGLELADIDMVIPHNPDMSDVATALGLGPERFFAENLARYSHSYASDVFVNYVTLRDAGRLVPGHHYVLVSTGLGAVYSATVITHRGGL